MRWKVTEPRGWHRWFAWYPVEMGAFWYWLEFVERRTVNEVDYFRDPQWTV